MSCYLNCRAVLPTILIILSYPAHAGLLVLRDGERSQNIAEQKLLHFDDPLNIQTTTECNHYFEWDAGLLGKGKTCDGWTTYQRHIVHEFWFIAEAADTSAEYQDIAKRCIAPATAAGYAAWIATPDPTTAVRFAAAAGAASGVFATCVAGFAIRIRGEPRDGWSDWHPI